MSRKLILTPYDHGVFDSTGITVNKIRSKANVSQIDTGHIILSAVTMAGVDSIYSFGEISNSQTKLIKRQVSNKESNKWVECHDRINKVFDNYGLNTPEMVSQTGSFKYFLLNILFAVETNSSIMLHFNPKKYYETNSLPPELTLPLKLLFDSVQSKEALLPIVNSNIEKDKILKLFDVFESKEFSYYKEAQTEIESNQTLTKKTISLIEKAGKDLYLKNSKLIQLKNTMIQAIPMYAKIVDLVFGKFLGIIASQTAEILGSQLQKNKSIPIYNFQEISKEMLKQSFELYLSKKVPGFDTVMEQIARQKKED